MDDEEYDIYDDLDVFTGDEKQEKEVNVTVFNLLKFSAPFLRP